MSRWLRIALLVLLVAAPATAQVRSYIGGKNKIRYDVFEWKVYETPHFRISHYDRVEPTLERLASFAESAYDDLARELNFQILEPIPMLAYATHAEFEQTNVIVGFIPEGVGAFATPVRNRMVLPVDLPDDQLQQLIAHELTHIFQYEILFQGRRGRAIYARPPLWFMEGMASYYGADESSREEAYMRDAALADRVPSLTNPPQGYMAYRFGHKVFEFVEAEWGSDGARDFVFAFRGVFGGGVDRVIQKTFNMDVEQFDGAFRAWLRRKYEPFMTRGTPREFGREFRVKDRPGALETSPSASPSGDLIAAFSTYKRDVDVVVFGVPDRRLYRNLTKGHTTDYEYLIAQNLTTGGVAGGDLAFSPDGNHVAVFARTERSRSLLLLDANRGGIAERFEVPLPIDQPLSPAFSADGTKIAFSAIEEGRYDIFLLDRGDGSITNLTDDDAFDASPSFSPDGRWLVYSSKVGETSKLFRVSLQDTSDRQQLTFGPGSDEGPAVSPDGARLYFASDRDQGVFDIYALDLETTRLTRLTRVIGAALNPAPVETLEGERVVYQAFSRGTWDLFEVDPNQGEEVGEVESPPEGTEQEPFVPDVTIPIDFDQAEPVTKRKLYLEDGGTIFGVDQDGRFISQSYLTFSDQYGDRRISAFFDSIDTFSNFRLSYFNLEPRLQWGVTAYDYRLFYLTGYDPVRDRFFDREQVYRYTGLSAIGQYPLSRYYRVEGSVGYLDRAIDQPFVNDQGQLEFFSYDDQGALASLGLVGDTTDWNSYGPHAGSRWEVRGRYVYDIEDGGTMSQDLQLDGRLYLPLSQRNEIALRLFFGMADGNRPNIYAFGGLDTIRGFRVRSLAGNRAAFTNIEWRFPLIDRLEMPFLRLREVRGRFFVDIGAAWWDTDDGEFNYLGEPGFQFIGEKTLPDGTVVGESGRLQDGVASYGFGLTINLFGLPMHWDFVKRWDFDETLGDTEVDFWIGLQF